MIVCNVCAMPLDDPINFEFTIDGNEEISGHVCIPCEETLVERLREALKKIYVAGFQDSISKANVIMGKKPEESR